MIAETSRQAFYALGSKKLGKRQQQVFDAVCELGSASNDLIAEQTGLPINVVTPRVNELVKMGYLGLERVSKNTHGFMAKHWSVRDPNDNKLKEIAHETIGAAVRCDLDYKY